MNDLTHLTDISRVDPQVQELIEAEERRQEEKIILIPSESFTPPVVREALASAFTSIYAEGYPRPAMRRCSTDELAELDRQLSSHRRYADWRFYKGTEMADVVESLAGRRAAECFATSEFPAERIFANVQPLSGSAANLAIYDAFVEPGETVMGLDLTEGGHLTHGSEFNITGKRYRIVSYATDRASGKLDYERIRQLAVEHQPRLLIGGFTSYPWKPDWGKLREIADEAGAILLADIAHTAGMAIAGVYPNPIGLAHVVMFTTHKTLCGPRGAVILSTEPEISDKIDSAIFPGEQGGPHVNKFAAIAVAFKLAQSEEFTALQGSIVANASYLAEALQREGLKLAYGGTDTHLLVVDLRALESETGFVMMGEIASRVLDLVGIVCNKNTIPGDHSAADAHGIRLGTPWASQRGMGKAEMEEIAAIIARVLRAVRPFSYVGLTGDLSRGKLPLSVLGEARERVRSLLRGVGDGSDSSGKDASGDVRSSSGILRVSGGRATALLDEASTAGVLKMKDDEELASYFFDEAGELVSEALVCKVAEEDYLLSAPREKVSRLKEWLSGLADGYILFDEDDIFCKVQGPALVEEIAAEAASEGIRSRLLSGPEKVGEGSDIVKLQRDRPERFRLDKPYFVGSARLDTRVLGEELPPFEWVEEEGALKKTALHGEHAQLGARFAPFAGWEMPVWYGSALEEHRAVRARAGLFDLGHMGLFEISGRYATNFLNLVTSNYAAWLNDGESQYAYLLDHAGSVIDDIFVYRRAIDRYLLVVNASNEEKNWEWLNGVNEGRYLVDRQVPSRRLGPRVTIRDLKKEDGMMDLALQGPASFVALTSLLERKERLAVSSLARTGFCEAKVHGQVMLIARTGYTGENVGYEIYTDKEGGSWLWKSLLEEANSCGVVPCGLASRDSTRTEAGLPLYGQELAGPHNVDPYEAGFGSYIKLHKPFFIGRDACIQAMRKQNREIVRFAVDAAGRPVHSGAAVIDRSGQYLGRVTSCVSLGDFQVGLALFDKVGVSAGTSITVLMPPRRQEAVKQSSDLSFGDRVATPLAAKVVSRFPEDDMSAAQGGVAE